MSKGDVRSDTTEVVPSAPAKERTRQEDVLDGERHEASGALRLILAAKEMAMCCIRMTDT